MTMPDPATKPGRESTFWKMVAEAASPGWSMKLDTAIGPNGESRLSQLKSFVYVIDMATGWTCTGGLFPSMFKELAGKWHTDRRGGPGGESTVDFLLSAVGQCAQSRETADSSISTATAAAAVVVLGGTQSYKQAVELTGSVEGHWFYLVYQLKDRTRIGRPVFRSGGERAPGLMSPEEVNEFAARVASMDLDPAAKSSVAQMIREGGGTAIADKFLDTAPGMRSHERPPFSRG